jgi:hypothetical protein
MPASARVVEGNHDVVSGAGRHVAVASGTAVALEGLVRLDPAHLDGAEVDVPTFSTSHASRAQSTNATATATPATTNT